MDIALMPEEMYPYPRHRRIVSNDLIISGANGQVTLHLHRGSRHAGLQVQQTSALLSCEKRHTQHNGMIQINSSQSGMFCASEKKPLIQINGSSKYTS